MNEKQASLFDKTEEQLICMHIEIGLLSKKKPDSPINKFKSKLINALIDKANDLLSKEYLPFDEFDGFDEDDLPTASDVVLMLSQYLKSISMFRFDHTIWDSGTCYWVLNGNKRMKTKPSKWLR